MKTPPNDFDRFVMSTELECLTCVRGSTGVPADPERIARATRSLLDRLPTLAPTLPGPSGIFNAYGRIYTDCGHVELAICECHSPYVLPLIVERQQDLVRQAVSQLAEAGTELMLACNNHDGLLKNDSAVWGSHENHTVSVHPTEWTQSILPFLVTRIYGGSGGIHASTGNFLAAVRPLCMKRASGGATTHSRAIHSTAREEHLMGPKPKLFRYHLILGDGHRSQFNLALHFGATALAIKAVIADPRDVQQRLDTIKGLAPGNWVALLKTVNVLQQPGQPLKIHPLVTQTQRIYLDAARRYVDRLDERPDWIEDCLRDWDDTLGALERVDRGWLAARLDEFAKYEFYTAVLNEQGLSWDNLPSRRSLFAELALLDHSYHDFSSDGSVFSILEKEGVLEHRVGPRVLPGEEPTPFVPELETRARARAQFIRDHSNESSRYLMDWSHVRDFKKNQIAALDGPGDEAYSDWKPAKMPV